MYKASIIRIVIRIQLDQHTNQNSLGERAGARVNECACVPCPFQAGAIGIAVTL